MNQATAEKLLAPFMSDLRDCVIDGFNDYHRQYAHVSYLHHPRTRACAIHDQISHYAKQRLLQFAEIHAIPTKLRNLFDLSGVAVFQFKKLSRQLQTSNLPTLFALEFNRQQPLSLPGIPASLPRLFIGYVPRRDWTAVEGVFVTYSAGRNLIWSIDLTNSSKQLTPILPLQIDDQSKHRTRRVRAKTQRKPDNRESTGTV